MPWDVVSHSFGKSLCNTFLFQLAACKIWTQDLICSVCHTSNPKKCFILLLIWIFDYMDAILLVSKWFLANYKYIMKELSENFQFLNLKHLLILFKESNIHTFTLRLWTTRNKSLNNITLYSNMYFIFWSIINY